MVMSHSLPARHDGARPRFRGAITTVLTILLAVMIVRDIFVRRFASPAPSATDVTRRAP
jgi:hypothetical protein